MNKIKYNSEGLVPVIIQKHDTNKLLMMAWMNEESLKKTIETKEAYFWSSSRKELWKKGSSSGNTQKVKEILVDCDNDTILIKVDPEGPACHTGEDSCFFKNL